MESATVFVKDQNTELQTYTPIFLIQPSRPLEFIAVRHSRHRPWTNAVLARTTPSSLIYDDVVPQVSKRLSILHLRNVRNNCVLRVGNDYDLAIRIEKDALGALNWIQNVGRPSLIVFSTTEFLIRYKVQRCGSDNGTTNILPKFQEPGDEHAGS